MNENLNESSEVTNTQEASAAPDPTEKKNADPKEALKLFTQDDVNRIVKERLKRLKTESASPEEIQDLKDRESKVTQRETDLKARETKVACREYLNDKNYPKDLLDIIDQTDFEAFKQKADKVMQISARKKTAPIASHEHTGSEGGDGFRKDVKHKPKPFYNYND